MMKRRDLLLASGAAALGLAASPFGWARAADARRRKLLVFTKSAGFEHSTIKREGDKPSHTETVITELGQKHGFDVRATKDGRVFDEDLDQFDAFFFYTTGDLTQTGSDGHPPMSAAGKQRFLDAITAGKGFVASHCGSDTFHTPGASRESQPVDQRDPYIAMLGGEFISHGPQQVAQQVVASKAFEALRDLGESFPLNDEWYSLKNYAEDMHVLLVMDTRGMEGKDYERPPFPATWARRHGEGRVFYTSMGHREDVWTIATFQKIFLGGLAWAFGDVEVDTPPNLKQAAPGAHVMPPA